MMPFPVWLRAMREWIFNYQSIEQYLPKPKPKQPIDLTSPLEKFVEEE